MRARLAQRIDRLWYSAQPPPVPLRALERLYRRVSRSRWNRPTERPPCPVVVVGNLVAGGSGKTPVVAAVTLALAAEGRRVAIITRGYASRAGTGPLRVAGGASARDVGDEALELARATGVDVWVGSNRRRALQAATETGADCVVSDDGLQHVRLPRSFEICVIDEKRGFGNGHLLPAGPLRQPPARLSQIDLVLIKRSSSGRIAGGIPDGFGFALEPGSPTPANPEFGSRAPRPGEAIDAVAGIADPAAFFDMLSGLGYRVRPHSLADHQPIDEAWLDRLPGPIVLTAKDRARLAGSVRDDAFVLPVRAALPGSVLQSIVEHVRNFPS